MAIFTVSALLVGVYIALGSSATISVVAALAYYGYKLADNINIKNYNTVLIAENTHLFGIALQSFNHICSTVPHSQAYPLIQAENSVGNYITLEHNYYIAFSFKEHDKTVPMFLSRETNGSLKIWTKVNEYQHKFISYLWACGDIAPSNAHNLPMYETYKKIHMPTIELTHLL